MVTLVSDATDVAAVADAVRAVPDPEIPVISLGDLGVVREVDTQIEGRVRVVMTPTYSGCPAMEAMRDAVVREIEQRGLQAQVEIRLTPAWTTDWMSDDARRRLAEFGIAPPAPTGPTLVPLGRRQVACPVCGSTDTEVVSAFGSTACKALRRCTACLEPFEEFKPL